MVIMLPRLLFLSLLCLPAFAADNPLSSGGGNSQPFDVEAQQSLEYNQTSRQYIARGAAKVTKGDMVVVADTLTGFERDKNGGGTEVYKFTADGNVRIENGKTTAYGDHADYGIDSQMAVLTGKNLRLIAENDVLTARDRFEYYADAQKAVAVGNAKAVRKTPEGTRTITADRMTAYFKKDKSGATVADRIEAEGNVKMLAGGSNGTDVATGNKGSYNPQDSKATLTGDVKLTRGPNQIEGNAAEVDVNSGESKMITAPGSTGNDKRVRGLLIPGSTDSPVKNTAKNP